jgi:hypothetical protein
LSARGSHDRAVQPPTGSTFRRRAPSTQRYAWQHATLADAHRAFVRDAEPDTKKERLRSSRGVPAIEQKTQPGTSGQPCASPSRRR